METNLYALQDLISPAELKLLQKLASDLSKQQIADEMGKSINTINCQQKSIMLKTRTNCRTGAVMIGIKTKMIAA